MTQASYSFELFKFHDLLSFKTILIYGMFLHNPVQQIVPWVPEAFSRAAGIFGVGRRHRPSKDLTETGNRVGKVSGIQGKQIENLA